MQLFYTVSKIAVISPYYKILTQKKYFHVQLDSLKCHMKIHPNHLDSVQENEAYGYCFLLKVTISQGQGHWKLHTMVKAHSAYKHGRYERIW